jgi:hypothetical protein
VTTNNNIFINTKFSHIFVLEMKMDAHISIGLCSEFLLSLVRFALDWVLHNVIINVWMLTFFKL